MNNQKIYTHAFNALETLLVYYNGQAPAAVQVAIKELKAIEQLAQEVKDDGNE